jgi:primosomal protein N' (replication factor Y)
MRAVRVGVSRVREELEVLAGTPVAEVTAEHDDPGPPTAAVVVGTEAVLHRVERADAVAFVDFDAELLAPRLRAGEEALALLARAARLVAPASPPVRPPSRAPGRLLVQTRQPRHAAVLAAVAADPGVLAAAEAPVRRELGLPPFRAQALVSGPTADAYGRALADAAAPGTDVRGPSEGTWSVLAPDHRRLAELLAAVPRPAGRLRVEVDPVRA